MVPTLYGRIQTRIVVLTIFGGAWTLFITLFDRTTSTLLDAYATAFTLLAVVLAFGIAWEFLYHGLQQFRWEKDWPTFFGLLTMIPEGVAVWFFAQHGPLAALGAVPVDVFVVHFATTWIATWLIANGPLRIVSLRWRFSGGRFW